VKHVPTRAAWRTERFEELPEPNEQGHCKLLDRLQIAGVSLPVLIKASYFYRDAAFDEKVRRHVSIGLEDHVFLLEAPMEQIVVRPGFGLVHFSLVHRCSQCPL
jgi:hypothetical protein